jgi:hypothetical protein
MKDIRDGLHRVGMDENRIYEIIEHLYCENNLISKYFNEESIQKSALKQFNYLIEIFNNIPYKFSIKDIILFKENHLAKFLYNFIMFKLKYDIEVKDKNEKFLSDYILELIDRGCLNPKCREDFLIYSFDRNMSIERVVCLIREKLNVDLQISLT